MLNNQKEHEEYKQNFYNQTNQLNNEKEVLRSIISGNYPKDFKESTKKVLEDKKGETGLLNKTFDFMQDFYRNNKLDNIKIGYEEINIPVFKNNEQYLQYEQKILKKNEHLTTEVNSLKDFLKAEESLKNLLNPSESMLVNLNQIESEIKSSIKTKEQKLNKLNKKFQTVMQVYKHLDQHNTFTKN